MTALGNCAENMQIRTKVNVPTRIRFCMSKEAKIYASKPIVPIYNCSGR